MKDSFSHNIEIYHSDGQAKSCWTCGWRQAGGITLFGFCKVFERIGKKPKEIPPTRADRGCSHFKEKDDTGKESSLPVL